MEGRLGLLLWLRYRTVLRGRSALGWVGFVALVLFVLIPFSLGLALLVRLGTLWAAEQGDPAILGEWVRLVLFALWLLFLLRPIVGFGANEFYDITKLFHFPVSHRTVFVAQTIGLTFGGTALFFLPTLAALAVSIPGGAFAAAGRFALLLLFLVHGVVLGQLIQLALLNVLRSRRFQDLAPILGALVSGGIYLAFRMVGMTDDPTRLLDDLLSRGLSVYLSPLPPAWAAGVVAPGPGVSEALLFVLGFLPLTALAVVLAAALQERAFHGEIAGARTRSRGAGPRRVRPVRFPLSLLPEAARAVARKELRLLKREPVVKAMLIQQFVFFVAPVGIAIFTTGERVPAAAVLSWVVYPFLFIESVLVLNLLGLEARGLQASLLSPAPRDHILLGKLLAYFALWGGLNLALLGGVFVALAALGSPPPPGRALALVFEATAALLVLLGIGAAVSVIAPTPIAGRGRGALAEGQKAREGCGTAVLRFAVLMLLMALIAPVTLLVRVTGSLLLAAAGLAYAFCIAMAGYRIGSRLLEEREERLLLRLGRSPD